MYLVLFFSVRDVPANQKIGIQVGSSVDTKAELLEDDKVMLSSWLEKNYPQSNGWTFFENMTLIGVLFLETFDTNIYFVG